MSTPQLPRTDELDLPELALKFYGRVPLAHCLAYLKFIKGGRVQRLLHQLKYRNQPEIGDLLGQWYAHDLRAAGLGEAFDRVVPVPLHASKQRRRGYNQSDGFARGLAQGLGIEWSATALVRTVPTVTQTRKRRFERWQNVEDTFAVADAAAVQHQRLLLADDVVTTGATLEAAASALLQAGAQSVSIAVIANAQ